MLRFFIGAVVFTFLGGCGLNHAEENGNEDQQVKMNQVESRILNEENQNVDQTLRVSQLAEQYVEKIGEVEGSHVIFADNNAYVAVRLANNSDPSNNRRSMGPFANQTDTLGTDYARNRENDGKETENEHKGKNIKANEYRRLPEVLEQEIAVQVRKADNNIQHVYVSVNPDFYSTMSTYADDIRSGRNKVSLSRDFSNSVTNFFGINNE